MCILLINVNTFVYINNHQPAITSKRIDIWKQPLGAPFRGRPVGCGDGKGPKESTVQKEILKCGDKGDRLCRNVVTGFTSTSP